MTPLLFHCLFQLLISVGMVTDTSRLLCIVHFTTTLSHAYPNTMMAALILSPHSDYLAVQLYYASSCGHDQEVLELLQRGAPPNNSDYYTREQRGYTPLHRACVNDNLRSAELLIKFGAIVAATDNDGCIPLHDVCLLNSKATAKLLLEHHRPTGEPGC